MRAAQAVVEEHLARPILIGDNDRIWERAEQFGVDLRGIEIIDPADEGSDGPASFMVTDPDGNPILFDQHV